LASGAADGTLKVWDLATKKEVLSFKAHSAAIRALAYSADGRILASASEDGTVKLWEPSTGTLRRTLEPNGGQVWALAFSPSGRTLVSGGEDMRLVVWDTPSGRERETARIHRGAITGLAVDPSRGELISAGEDATLLRWSAPRVIKVPTPQPKPSEATTQSTASAPKQWLAAEQTKDEPAPAGVVELLEDRTDFLIDNLHNNGAADASIAETNKETFFSGVCSLSITEFQRFNAQIPGWKYEIAENPKPGQFRYVRFAWKRTEAPGIMLQFHAWPNTWHRYYAGTVSDDTQAWGPMTRVAEDPPRQWELITRDLFKDFGPMTITGIGFSAMEGPSHAYFDHIYLGRTIEDLDGVTARLKGIADAPHAASGGWLTAATFSALAIVLAAGGWLIISRSRRTWWILLPDTQHPSST
jgi:hypothetical protein